ncbi:ABC transporter substrate-binding protein [Mycetocola zhujimingii]|uniref:ABC transporter substrate-binding protein n=1 Tax=Mycetocola zhujimingii TaxID=2079792 RepID=UPI000D3B34BF|nr:sugar ABC transporter substrate-binding protein [Mycetocola zhujimingii]AWB85375.1 sugar ABC transporter substrate-binding protein [Mycetocola zhujimingii]
MKQKFFRRRGAIAAAVVMTLTLASCAPSPDTGGTAEEADESAVDAALEEGGELLVWGWDPTLEPVVEAFRADYPNVDIELVNVGSGVDHFTALQNAASAGSGIPDVTMLSYYAIPQFVAAGTLTDLTPFGVQDLESNFPPGPWSSVISGDAVYGLPTDSGPRVMVYNKVLFDELGLEVPETWDEYVEAARAIRAANPDASILAENADTLKTLSHIWAAGGRPFEVDGSEVTIDLDQEGTERYVETWQTLLDEDLLSPIRDYSDEWYQALGNGNIATMVMGAWITGSLLSGLPESSGEWRVAPLPQFDDSEYVTSELGGSGMSVTEASENKTLAYGFVRYANLLKGLDVRIENGQYPASREVLDSPDFLESELEFYGGQQANKVFAESSANVGEGWQYLPFQVYANTIFADYMGPAYTGEVQIKDALEEWADAIAEYGESQGFTVNR